MPLRDAMPVESRNSIRQLPSSRPCAVRGKDTRLLAVAADAPTVVIYPANLRALGQYFVDDLAMDIGQAEIAALMSECQPLVIDAQAVQNRGVKVVDVNRVLLHVVAEVVCFAEHDTGLDTAARHPLGVTAWVMVSAVVGFGESALAVNRASELATPNDQRVV